LKFKYFTIKIIILNIIFTYFLNGEFIKKVLLKDLQIIQTINISYKNTYGHKQTKSITINSIILNDSIIFSELKQDTFIDGIFLKKAKSINSISIEYLNKDNNHINKMVNIKDSNIINSNLYIYEDNDYIYKNIRKNHKPKKVITTKNILVVTTKNIPKKKIYKKVFSSKNSLSVEYFDNKSYVDLIINKCNKINNFCNDAKFSKLKTRAIFYLPFKVRNTKKINLSKNIKRIQVAYDSTRKSPCWLVVGGFNKMSKIKRMYYQDDELTFKKPSSLNNKKAQLAYRIYFE
jgi:hypothetical protein